METVYKAVSFREGKYVAMISDAGEHIVKQELSLWSESIKVHNSFNLECIFSCVLSIL